MLSNKANHIDAVLLIVAMTLMLMSIGIVYSASAYRTWLTYGESEKMLISHTVKVLIAIIVLFVVMKIDYHKFQHISKFLLTVAVISLLVTLFFGTEVRGTTRWLRVFIFGFQPADFARFALLIHLCTMIAVKGERIKDFTTGYLPMMFWIALVTGLVVLQPDFSMAAMIFVLGIMLIFIGGVRLRHLLLTLAMVIPILAIFLFSAPYRQRRVEFYYSLLQSIFSGNYDDMIKNNYQLWQGIIAFGRGGIFGTGPGESIQRDFFLPESYGDFVFPIVGEEYGLLGSIAVIFLFLVLMYRGFKIASFAEDIFGRLLALGMTCGIILFALVNAAVTLALLPTTGLPMPFISYGGSSMVFSAIAVGILLNISSQTNLYPRALQVKSIGEVNMIEINGERLY